MWGEMDTTTFPDTHPDLQTALLATRRRDMTVDVRRRASYNTEPRHRHVPHEQRTQPAIDDTLAELDAACKLVVKGDCITVLGDFNVQLPGKQENLTGSHVCATEESVAVGKVMNIMRRHELCATNTMFRKRKGPATFLRKISDKVDTHDQFVGRQVKTKWKVRIIHGEVVHFCDKNNQRRWRVKFEDDYVCQSVR